MDAPISHVLEEFLLETGTLIERLEELPAETVSELYGMLGSAAAIATENISKIDPELRVELCGRQDKVLERIIDMDIPRADGGARRHVYTPAVQEYRRWKNVELLKDKCLTGYMLAEEIGAKPVMMFCDESKEYPYRDFLPGLELLYTGEKRGEAEVYRRHLQKDYRQMDILILHGIYDETLGYLNGYRQARPDGKVYCGLDMNSFWMGWLGWKHEPIKEFSSKCDVVATSCRAMRDALNRHPDVNFSCRWIPNGFFNAGSIQINADESLKENVILTVGRIGTDQKRNGELLLAFAKVSTKLQDWSLRLVGPVEQSFKPFIEKYFQDNPHLKSKVVFTGVITDKEELFGEYARAKLFALTSKLEGGTPNVYAEALFHGCMFATSDIDAADDITNYNSLGLTYRKGDIDALANVLTKLTAKASDRAALARHIAAARSYASRYYDWRRNAKKIAYMLEH